MATHSSILAWEIPWKGKPDRLQSMGRKESNTTENLTLSLWTRQISLKIVSSPENEYQQVIPRVGSVCTRCLESDSSG